MDIEFEYAGTTFVWHDAKARENERKHSVDFLEAATVFYDPLVIFTDAGREAQARDKVIGFSAGGRLLTVVHIEIEGEFIRIISAWRTSAAEETLYDQ
jgi:Uncharacterized protein conserved in bacteria